MFSGGASASLGARVLQAMDRLVTTLSGATVRRPAFDTLRRMTAPVAESPTASDDRPQEPQARLVAAIARGDEAALGQLYETTLGKVYGYALRIVGKPEAAEEVVGEVYLQVWHQAGRYDATRGSVMAWLMMATRSRALDHLRRQDSADSHPDPAIFLESENDEGARPLDLLLAVEDRSRVAAALAELTPVQRQMIALAFFRDLSHQEIADTTGMPLGTVKSHIRRALEKLRPKLEGPRHD